MVEHGEFNGNTWDMNGHLLLIGVSWNIISISLMEFDGYHPHITRLMVFGSRFQPSTVCIVMGMQDDASSFLTEQESWFVTTKIWVYGRYIKLALL